jgi:hypothetical protein
MEFVEVRCIYLFGFSASLTAHTREIHRASNAEHDVCRSFLACSHTVFHKSLCGSCGCVAELQMPAG